MAYTWMDAYCLQKKGVTKDYQTEWQAYRYFVGGKMFAMQGTDKSGAPIFTVKLPPETGLLLRDQFTDIVPGYYMNKMHWNSLYLEGSVPEAIVQDMLDAAYAVTLGALSKKLQKEILAEE